MVSPNWEGVKNSIQTIFKEYTRIKFVSEINEGWESDIFAFDVVQNKNTIPIVARVLRGRKTTRRAREEKKLLKLLYSHNVPVPYTYGWVSKTKEHKGMIVMERILGPALGQLMLEAEPKELEQLIQEFVDLHNLVHSVNWDTLYQPNYDITKQPLSFVNSRLDRYKSGIDKSKFREDLLPLIADLEETIELAKCKELKLLHNDFHPFNILTDHKGRKVIIDWTGVDIGDVRFDIAWTILLFASSGESNLANLVKQKYFSQYQLHAKKFDYFQRLVCLRRLIDFTKILENPDSHLSVDLQSKQTRLFLEFASSVTGLEFPLITTEIFGV